MARVPYVEREEVTDPMVLQAYEAMEKKRGKVTHIYKALAHCPHILRVTGPFVVSVQNPDEIDARLKEKIMSKVSMVNESAYCTYGHRGISRKQGIPEEEFDELKDLSTARHLSPAERTALRYAEYLTLHPEGVPDELFEELKSHYTDSQIVEITALAALYNLINRANAALALDLEEY